MGESIRLLPITESDLPKIIRFEWDPDAIGELDWFGYRMDRARRLEQTALERAGFRREGVMRGHHFRAGEWRDSVMYAVLRPDHAGA